MELPGLGQHCSETSCNRLDFLPVKCDSCYKIFCKDHMFYADHNCKASYKLDVQVPICPLCNKPIPVKKGELPDIKVGEHIDSDCLSDPAKQKRKIYTNRCSQKGCRQKEMINITCSTCQRTYCLKHRHPQDHSCKLLGASNIPISKSGSAALSRLADYKQARGGLQHFADNQRSLVEVQGELSEEEAVARAIHMSLQDGGDFSPQLNDQQNKDHLMKGTFNSKQGGHNSSKDRCIVS